MYQFLRSILPSTTLVQLRLHSSNVQQMDRTVMKESMSVSAVSVYLLIGFVTEWRTA